MNPNADPNDDQSASNAPPIATQQPDTSLQTPQTPQPVAASTAQPSQTISSQPQMVSNPTPVDPNASHPAVQAGSIIHSIGQALAGGPRVQTTIDPQTGTVTRTPVRLSSREIGMSIAAAALTGAFSGLGQRGPGATGNAAASGFQTTFQQQQAAKAQQEARS